MVTRHSYFRITRVTLLLSVKCLDGTDHMGLIRMTFRSFGWLLMIRLHGTILNIFSLQNQWVKTLVPGSSNHNHIMAWNCGNMAPIIDRSKIDSYFPSCQDSWESSSGVISKPVWFGQLAQNNEGICYLKSSKQRLRMPLRVSQNLVFDTGFLFISSSLRKAKVIISHLSLMSCVGCATPSGKDMPHIIFPAICVGLESKDRPREKKELASSHMTTMNSRTQGFSSAFPHRIPPEPWGQSLQEWTWPLEKKRFNCSVLFIECVHQSSFPFSPEHTDISQASL